MKSLAMANVSLKLLDLKATSDPISARLWGKRWLAKETIHPNTHTSVFLKDIDQKIPKT